MNSSTQQYKETANTFNNMDNFQRHYTKRRKLDIEEYILYDFFYTKSWTGRNYYIVLEITLTLFSLRK